MLSLENILESQIRQVTREWREVLTDFMPLEEIMALKSMLDYSGVNYRIDGGHEEAARVRLYMTMHEEELSAEDMHIHVIRFSGNTKFIDFSHRDCLGALMSLGFERKCIGDIFIREQGFDVLTNGEIDDYLLMSNLSIKRVPMRVTLLDLANWEAPAPKLETGRIQVMQSRLDAVIAKVYNLSRTQAVNLIKAGMVQVNHVVSLSSSKQCEEGMVISVRGHGKFRMGPVDGMSKKGKINLLIEKYV